MKNEPHAMKQKLLDLIRNKPRHFAREIKKDPELWAWVQQHACVDTVNTSELIWSAIHQEGNRCVLGQVKKFDSVNRGYRFCGPAGVCTCARTSVSAKVSQTKKQYSDSRRLGIQQKRIDTALARYGVSNNAQTQQARRAHAAYYLARPKKAKLSKPSTYQKLNDKFQRLSHTRFLTPESQYHGVDNQRYYDFVCQCCGSVFADYIDNGHLPICKKCHPRNPAYVSQQEIQVFDYVQEITGGLATGTDKSIINPYELDIVVESKQIAIEYCGLYWHSEAVRTDPNYHKNKMDLCKKKGYRLITIFEDEWMQRCQIVKQRLRSVLQVDDRIPARGCVVEQIPSSRAREFLEHYHLQGPAVSGLALGCFYRDSLVAVMTFGKPRYDRSLEWELIRYCSINTVVGGAGKLFAFFKKNHDPGSVVSYCDLRWGSGNLYHKLGFVRVDRVPKPSYGYTDFVNRYHRSRFTKSRLVQNPSDDARSESDLARQKGLFRIWDCGQDKWVWTAKNTE